MNNKTTEFEYNLRDTWRYTKKILHIYMFNILQWINRRVLHTYPLIEECARCRDCGRNVHDYHVPDEIWLKVIGSFNGVWCYDCFCDRAEKKGIHYRLQGKKAVAMCDQGDTVLMWLPNGEQVEIDRCIVPIVSALNSASIYTAGCCCGHKKELGHIWLRHGKVLVILPDDTTKDELIEAIRMKIKA